MMFQRLREVWEILTAPSPCAHQWRPALTVDRKPAKVCRLCAEWQQINEEEFYAVFGKMPRSPMTEHKR